jgi:hypothetical protein
VGPVDRTGRPTEVNRRCAEYVKEEYVKEEYVKKNTKRRMRKGEYEW